MMRDNTTAGLRLLSAQTTKHDGKRDFCLRCLNSFASAESLTKHKEYCRKHSVARRDLPKPENATVQFKNLNYSMRVPYIVYADFEAFTKPVVEFYLYPTVSTALVHSVKPKLTE